MKTDPKKEEARDALDRACDLLFEMEMTKRRIKRRTRQNNRGARLVLAGMLNRAGKEEETAWRS